MSSAVITESPVAPRPIGPGLIAALALAQVGAFLSFTPLLAILAPLKAAEIDPAGKAALMAQVSFWGAVVAGLANLGVGVLSDGTVSRLGRRRPWLAIGLAGTVASYLVIMQAGTAAGLIAGVLLFQLCLNLLFGPLVAMLPDQVPDGQKGRVAAFLGLAPPIGAIAGAAIAGLVLAGQALSYAAIAVLLVIATLPLIVVARDPPTGTGWFAIAPRPLSAPDLGRVLGRDFLIAGASRLLMQFSVTVITLFTLFSIQDRMRPPGGLSPAGLMSLMMVAASVVQIGAGLAGGFISDRLRRRKAFVVAAGLLLAAAATIIAIAPDWRLTGLAFLMFGIGFGFYTTVDVALVTQVLPSLETSGRDLGLINLANTLPQMIAPVVGAWLLAGHADYRSLYLAAAASAAVGGLLVLGVRSVR